MQVNILGTKYSVIFGTLENEGGKTNFEKKTITIDKSLDKFNKERIIRHEVVHAYLYESGIALTYDETIVDWFGVQMPKLVDTVNQIKKMRR